MRLSDLAKGSSVFLGVIVAGYVSTVYVDQRFASPPKTTSETGLPAPTSIPATTDSPAPANSGSPCIGEGGSWKNWPWPNVPMGSPKCP
ncbi:hypothetical protein [Bradyrhizobium sp. CCBAU 11434]|uniref:hypothetical protein n=1 Tax=Bradyrhizobium sp. CCBAU 11434 TaxID=1630885 RepID=UPI0023051BBF|nr:hypothetical protein [Bradyrhizobium sp. CCBAU 11434]